MAEEKKEKPKKLKLSVCCIVKDDTFWLEMMMKSASEFADEIIIVDDIDPEKDGPNKELCKKFEKAKYVPYPFGENFGAGRKKACTEASGDWIFFLDADEVIHEENTPQIRGIFEECEKREIDCIHIEYVHFIHDFTHIDNSECLHIGIQRAFKNYDGIEYPRVNHSLPVYKFKQMLLVPQIIIWHLGYLRGMYKIMERFARNIRVSEMHAPVQQVRWRDWHYFGEYPTKSINPHCIPEVIKETFLMKKGGGAIK